MVPVLFALVFGHSQNPYSAKPFPNVFSSTLVSWACGSDGSHGAVTRATNSNGSIRLGGSGQVDHNLRRLWLRVLCGFLAEKSGKDW